MDEPSRVLFSRRIGDLFASIGQEQSEVWRGVSERSLRLYVAGALALRIYPAIPPADQTISAARAAGVLVRSVEAPLGRRVVSLLPTDLPNDPNDARDEERERQHLAGRRARIGHGRKVSP